MIDQLFAKLHKGKPVPAPSAPPPLNFTTDPFHLPVPFALEEMPHQFLRMLLESNELTATGKRYVSSYLADFEPRLEAYLHSHYGEGASQLTSMITEHVVDVQKGLMDDKDKKQADNVLGELEANWDHE